MAAKSKHWAEVNRWLNDVIDSCITHAHIGSTLKLVANYRKLYIQQYKIDDLNFKYDCDMLRDKVYNKLDEIITPDEEKEIKTKDNG